jgi:DNA-binding transcriptional regulator LsrR (DeoR family)
LVLLLIDQRAPIGRRTLSEELEIKDGIIRGLLERLAEQDVVKVTPYGVQLSKTGKEKLKAVLRDLSMKKMVQFENLQLAPGHKAVAAQISDAYCQTLTGVIQRDESIKAGANGAITITANQGKLRIPPDNKKVESLAPEDNRKLSESFVPRQNDVILIGFAETYGRALAGTVAAIFSLQ